MVYTGSLLKIYPSPTRNPKQIKWGEIPTKLGKLGKVFPKKEDEVGLISGQSGPYFPLVFKGVEKEGG